MNKEKLFAEFPPVTTAQWEDIILKDLKGADYDKRLVWKTPEGFSVRPYYRAEDLEKLAFMGAGPGEFPYVRGTKKDNNWLVRQQILVRDAAEANARALEILMRGVQSIDFHFEFIPTSVGQIEELLKGIDLHAVELFFSGVPPLLNGMPKLVMEVLEKMDLRREEIRVGFEFDPCIWKLSMRGDLTCIDLGAFCLGLVTNLIKQNKPFPNNRVLTVGGRVLRNCGATIAQELGYAMAIAHDYIVRFGEQGLAIDEIAGAIQFKFGVGSDYFMEIAKLRAARMLWANIVNQYEPKCAESAKMRSAAITTAFNQTVYDPYVNMLRGTTEAMSAALGGADTIEVLPFDSAYEEPGEFSDRIARNVQLLLKEESHFDQVADPAGGAYYIENLTASIAEAAWKIFLDVEERGGYVEACKKGYIKQEIEKSADTRRKNIATRRETLLGTNQYPNFLEKATDGIFPTTVGASEGCSCGCDDTPPMALRVFRGAMDFEQLRLAVDRSGKNPRAFMLTVGNLAMARARAQFASNFFACAGIEPVDNLMFNSVQQGVDAALKAGAEIVVLCSSDDEYAEFAPEAFKALNGKAIFVVAGAPACQAELEAQGIKNFVNVRSNVLETLKGYAKELGVELYK